MNEKVLKYWLSASPELILWGFLFLFSIINDENAGNVVIYELIIITIVLWGISLVRSLRY